MSGDVEGKHSRARTMGDEVWRIGSLLLRALALFILAIQYTIACVFRMKRWKQRLQQTIDDIEMKYLQGGS